MNTTIDLVHHRNRMKGMKLAMGRMKDTRKRKVGLATKNMKDTNWKVRGEALIVE